jgi:hypothetical protein
MATFHPSYPEANQGGDTCETSGLFYKIRLSLERSYDCTIVILAMDS